MKIAFLFPGQGAQQVGMGHDIYDAFEVARDVFDQAEMQVSFDLKQLCFKGPIETLSQTEYTQACLVACEIAMLRVLNEQGITADAYAGLSLGEYSALVAAGALEANDAIALVRKRGQIMSEALPAGTSTMSAVLGMAAADLEVVCQEASAVGIVEIANYNCPGQLVIGGEVAAVAKAGELAVEKGARKVIPLNVSGAFHTSLLKAAGMKLRTELAQIKWRDLEKPVVFNKTANYQDAPLIDLLEAQVYSSVRFEDSIRRMIADGIDTFIEVGPGKTLSAFVKKIDRNVKIYNASTLENLQNLIKEVKNHG